MLFTSARAFIKIYIHSHNEQRMMIEVVSERMKEGGRRGGGELGVGRVRGE